MHSNISKSPSKISNPQRFRDSIISQIKVPPSKKFSVIPQSSSNLRISTFKISPPVKHLESNGKERLLKAKKKLSLINLIPAVNLLESSRSNTYQENDTKRFNDVSSENKRVPRQRTKFRLSVMTSNIKAILEEKKNIKLEHILEEKKEKDEMEDLKSQMGNLRKTLENTKDAKALAMISKKVFVINSRISTIMKKQKERDDYANKLQPTEEDLDENISSSRDSSKLSKITSSVSSEEDQISPEIMFCRAHKRRSNSLKVSDLKRITDIFKNKGFKKKQLKSAKSLTKIATKKFNIKDFELKTLDLDRKMQHNENRHKVAQILLEYNIMEHKDKIDNKKFTNVGYKNTMPDWHFIRPKGEKTLYQPATNIKKESTLYQKSYRPNGFKNDSNKIVPSKNSSANQILNAKRNTIDDMLNYYEIDKEISKSKKTFPDFEVNKTFLTGTRSENFKKLPKLKNEKDEVNPVLKENLLNRFKTTFTQMLQDSNTIQKNIYDIFINKKRIYREEDFQNLLVLFDKNPKNKTSSKENKEDGYKLKHSEKTREKEAYNLLKKLRPSVRKIYNEAFKKIEFEDRILNKAKVSELMSDEKSATTVKMKREMKKIAWEAMFMMGKQIDDGKDTEIKEIFKAEYSNLDYLEWQIKKKTFLGK
jgi:myosin heavy subunit